MPEFFLNGFFAFYRAVLVLIGIVYPAGKNNANRGVRNERYPGPHGGATPVKIFYPRKSIRQTIILYPGASPYAEEHPAMKTVGGALARAGYLVFIPRIPPLKDLIITEDLIGWMICFYKWVLRRRDVNPKHVSLVGMSFGGALVLKMLIKPEVRKHPPKSVLVYGSFYDINTAFEFLLTGKMTINGKTVTITPNEWGVIVLFHNFLGKVDVGYNTDNVQRILALRVKDLLEESITESKKLSGKERALAEALLKSKPTPEVRRITTLIREQCKPDLERLSPKSWCHRIDMKVFVMHGANDSMSPFTESIKLAASLKNSRLLISYLYKHREISTDRGFLFRTKELLRLLSFLCAFMRCNDSA